jgi:hypothetical protein
VPGEGHIPRELLPRTLSADRLACSRGLGRKPGDGYRLIGMPDDECVLNEPG